MNIGDRVRAIREDEEGIIKKIKGNLVEVDIGDGFVLEYQKTELTPIHEDEKYLKPIEDKTQSPKQVKPKQTPVVLADRGIYVAFVKLNAQKLEMYLINNTDYNLPFLVSKEIKTKTHEHIAHGMLGSRQSQQIDQLSFAQLEKWDKFSFQFLYAQDGYKFEYHPPHTFSLLLNAKKLHKSQKIAPLMGKEAYTFQLDQMITATNTANTITADELKGQMCHKEDKDQIPIGDCSKPRTIDLHIEKLCDNHATMPKKEMLPYQLSIFKKEFDNAIKDGVDEIIFIHGVGDGTLSKSIHKHISGHPNVEFFEDAKKEKFGYGATLIRIK